MNFKGNDFVESFLDYIDYEKSELVVSDVLVVP